MYHLLTQVLNVQICVAVKIEVAKDVHGEYPDPLLAFFAASAEPDANGHTVHHGFLNFGVGSTCTQAGDFSASLLVRRRLYGIG